MLCCFAFAVVQGSEREIEQTCGFSFIVSASNNGDSFSEARCCKEAYQEVQAHAAWPQNLCQGLLSPLPPLPPIFPVRTFFLCRKFVDWGFFGYHQPWHLLGELRVYKCMKFDPRLVGLCADKLEKAKGYWFQGSPQVQGDYADAQHRVRVEQEDQTRVTKWFPQVFGS